MTAGDQSPGFRAAEVYQGFIEAVNRHDLEAAGRFVDAARYRENCVGFTHGFVGWEQARESVRQVWKGLPDLRVELAQVLADGDVALAHGTVGYTGRRPPSARTRPASSTTSRSKTARSSSGSSKPTCSGRCASSTARHWA